MDTRPANIQLKWLNDARAEAPGQPRTDGDLDDQPLAFPPELGSGSFDLLHLGLGISFLKGRHQFLPAAAGRMVPFGELKLTYPEPTFMVQSIRHGRACHRESLPEATVVFEDGKDLFCYAKQRQVMASVDGSSASEMVTLHIGISSLRNLIGAEDAETLLRTLGLAHPPALAVRPMPKALSRLLHEAMSRSFTGPARKLFAQAKALEYLSSLLEHLHASDGHRHPKHHERAKIKALHGELLELEGKLPTLEELAQRVGIPARRLNGEFVELYGESIYSFITGHRLDQARGVLILEDLPMKVLAERLGYSHVNHFINAFRRRFGQAPGRVRREARQA